MLSVANGLKVDDDREQAQEMPVRVVVDSHESHTHVVVAGRRPDFFFKVQRVVGIKVSQGVVTVSSRLKVALPRLYFAVGLGQQVGSRNTVANLSLWNFNPKFFTNHLSNDLQRLLQGAVLQTVLRQIHVDKKSPAGFS